MFVISCVCQLFNKECMMIYYRYYKTGNRREWEKPMTMEGSGDETWLNLGMGIGISRWEQDEVGLKKDISAHLSSSPSSATSHTRNVQFFGYIWCTAETRLVCGTTDITSQSQIIQVEKWSSIRGSSPHNFTYKNSAPTELNEWMNLFAWQK